MKRIFTVILYLLLCNFLNAQHLKKDGTPDMRYKENKQTYSSTTTVTAVPRFSNDANGASVCEFICRYRVHTVVILTCPISLRTRRS